MPKRVHDLKLALHVLCGLDVDLQGAVDDSMLLSYALNPTHTTQTLADVAARHNQHAPDFAAGRRRYDPGSGARSPRGSRTKRRDARL